jgi:imidazolonepropionase-like amidohydrolase
MAAPRARVVQGRGRVLTPGLIDGDPLGDIEVLERPEHMHAVVQGGRVAVDRGL